MMKKIIAITTVLLLVGCSGIEESSKVSKENKNENKVVEAKFKKQNELGEKFEKKLVDEIKNKKDEIDISSLVDFDWDTVYITSANKEEKENRYTVFQFVKGDKIVLLHGFDVNKADFSLNKDTKYTKDNAVFKVEHEDNKVYFKFIDKNNKETINNVANPQDLEKHSEVINIYFNEISLILNSSFEFQQIFVESIVPILQKGMNDEPINEEDKSKAKESFSVFEKSIQENIEKLNKVEIPNVPDEMKNDFERMKKLANDSLLTTIDNSKSYLDLIQTSDPKYALKTDETTLKMQEIQEKLVSYYKKYKIN